jgi:hypothetical protein
VKPLLSDGCCIFAYLAVVAQQWVYMPQYCDMMAESWNGAAKKEAAVAMQLRGKHISAATNQHATTEELLEVVSTMWSMPRLYNEEQRGKLGEGWIWQLVVLSCIVSS